MCEQRLTRNFIIMAVKSIKLMVPPGYFWQLLFAWYQTLAEYSLPIQVLWAQQLCILKWVHIPKNTETTYAVKRHLYFSRNWRAFFIISCSSCFTGFILRTYECHKEMLAIILLCWRIHHSTVLCQCRWDGARGQKMSLFTGLQSSFWKATIRFFWCPPAPFCAAKQLNVSRSHGQHGRATSEREAKLICLFNCSQKLPP